MIEMIIHMLRILVFIYLYNSTFIQVKYRCKHTPGLPRVKGRLKDF